MKQKSNKRAVRPLAMLMALIMAVTVFPSQAVFASDPDAGSDAGSDSSSDSGGSDSGSDSSDRDTDRDSDRDSDPGPSSDSESTPAADSDSDSDSDSDADADDDTDAQQDPDKSAGGSGSGAGTDADADQGEDGEQVTDAEEGDGEEEEEEEEEELEEEVLPEEGEEGDGDEQSQILTVTLEGPEGFDPSALDVQVSYAAEAGQFDRDDREAVDLSAGSFDVDLAADFAEMRLFIAGLAPEQEITEQGWRLEGGTYVKTYSYRDLERENDELTIHITAVELPAKSVDLRVAGDDLEDLDEITVAIEAAGDQVASEQLGAEGTATLALAAEDIENASSFALIVSGVPEGFEIDDKTFTYNDTEKSYRLTLTLADLDGEIVLPLSAVDTMIDVSLSMTLSETEEEQSGGFMGAARSFAAAFSYNVLGNENSFLKEGVTVELRGYKDGELVDDATIDLKNHMTATGATTATINFTGQMDSKLDYRFYISGFDMNYEPQSIGVAGFDWKLDGAAAHYFELKAEDLAAGGALHGRTLNLSMLKMDDDAMIVLVRNFYVNNSSTPLANHPITLDIYDVTRDAGGAITGYNLLSSHTENTSARGIVSWEVPRKYVYHLKVERPGKEYMLNETAKELDYLTFVGYENDVYEFELDPARFPTEDAILGSLTFLDTMHDAILVKTFDDSMDAPTAEELAANPIWLGMRYELDDIPADKDVVHWAQVVLEDGRYVAKFDKVFYRYASAWKDQQAPGNEDYAFGQTGKQGSLTIYEYVSDSTQPISVSGETAGNWQLAKTSEFNRLYSYPDGVQRQNYNLWQFNNGLFILSGDTLQRTVTNGKATLDFGSTQPEIEGQIQSSVYEGTYREWTVEKLAKKSTDPDSAYAHVVEVNNNAKGDEYTIDYQITFQRGGLGHVEEKTLIIQNIYAQLNYDKRAANNDNTFVGTFYLTENGNRISSVDASYAFDLPLLDNSLVSDSRNYATLIVPCEPLTATFKDGADYAVVFEGYFIIDGERYGDQGQTGEGAPMLTTKMNVDFTGSGSTGGSDQDPMDEVLKNYVDQISVPEGYATIKNIALGSRAVNNDITFTAYANLSAAVSTGRITSSGTLEPDANGQITVKYSVTYTDTTEDMPCDGEYKIPNVVSAMGENTTRPATPVTTGNLQGKRGNEAEVRVTVPTYAFFRAKKTILDPDERIESGVRFELYTAAGLVAYAETNGATADAQLAEFVDAATGERYQINQPDYDREHDLYLLLDSDEYPPVGWVLATDYPGNANGKVVYKYPGKVKVDTAVNDKLCGPTLLSAKDVPNTGLTVHKNGQTAGATFYLYRDGKLVETFTAAEAAQSGGHKITADLPYGDYVLYEVTELHVRPVGAEWTLATTGIPTAVQNAAKGKNVWEQKLTIGKDALELSVDVTNTPSDDLVIRKDLPDGRFDTDDSFTFRVFPAGVTNYSDLKQALTFRWDSGASAYVYDANGTTDLTISNFTVSGSAQSGEIRLTGIPYQEGPLQIVEVEPARKTAGTKSVQVYDWDQEVKKVTIGFDGKVLTANFTNSLKESGALTVEKKATGDMLPGAEFRFQVLDENNQAIDLVLGDNISFIGNGRVDPADKTVFILEVGAEAIITGLTMTKTYTVQEIDADGYVTTVTGGVLLVPIVSSETAVIVTDEAQQVTFINSRRTDGTLDLVKTVEGNWDAGDSFEFTISPVTDGMSYSINANKQDVPASGKITVAKPAGGNTVNIHFAGLTYGQVYLIEETNTGTKYELKSVNGDSSTTTAKLEVGQSATFVNTRKQNGRLSFEKKVVSPVDGSGVQPGASETFTFSVSPAITAANLAPGSTGVSVDGSGNLVIQGSAFSAGGVATVHLIGLDLGATYTIREISTGTIYTVTPKDGVKIVAEETAGAPGTITNTLNSDGSIKLQKTVSGSWDEMDEFEFEISPFHTGMTYTVNNRTLPLDSNKITIGKATGVVTIGGLIQNQDYTITETKSGANYSLTTPAGVNSITLKPGQSANFQNTRDQNGALIFRKSVVSLENASNGVQPDPAETFTFKISPALPAGASVSVGTLSGARDTLTLTGADFSALGVAEVTFENLELGMTYTFTETNTGKQYTVDHTGNTAEATVAGTNSATIVNHLRDNASIELSKQIVGYSDAAAYPATGFQFALYRRENGAWVAVDAQNDPQTIGYGQSVQWTGLMFDGSYRIYEQAAAGYRNTHWTASTSDEDRALGAYYYDVPAFTDGNIAIALTAQNTPNKLTVAKTLQSGNKDTSEFTFKVQSAGGYITANKVADGVYSYTGTSATGTDFPVTAGKSVEIIGLPDGAYTIEETGANGYIPVITAGGQITVSGGSASATIQNNSNAQLTIEKKITGGAATESFEVELQVGGQKVPVYLDGGVYTIVKPANGTPVTLTISQNSPITITGLVPGVTYTVVETDAKAANYKVTYDPAGADFTPADASASGTVTVQNDLDTGETGLKLTKKTEGSFTGDETFQITVTDLDDPSWGPKTFTLGAGDTVDVPDVIVGHRYEATETAIADVTPSYANNPATVAYGEIEVITVQNTRDTTGNQLTVQKVLADETTPDLDAQFTFTITNDITKKPVANHPFTIQPSGSGTTTVDGQFTLKAGETAVFENLEAGVRYTVEEIDSSANYQLKGITGSPATMDGSDQAIVVTNERKSGDLSLTKQVDGTVLPSEKDTFVFAFAYLNGMDYNLDGVTVKSGNATIVDGKLHIAATAFSASNKSETVVLTGLPEGVTFRVTETTTGVMKYKTTVNGGEATSGEVTVGGQGITFLNVPDTGAEIEVTKSVKGMTTAQWPTEGFTFELYRLNDWESQGAQTATAANPTVKWENLIFGETYRIYEKTGDADGYRNNSGWTQSTTAEDIARGAYYKDITGATTIDLDSGMSQSVENAPTLLIVEKTLEAGNNDTRAFTFGLYTDAQGQNPVSLKAIDGGYRHAGASETGTVTSFDLSAGQKARIYGLPHGTYYLIEQTDNDYQPLSKTIVINDSTPNSQVTAENQRTEGSLTVQKTIKSGMVRDEEIVQITITGPIWNDTAKTWETGSLYLYFSQKGDSGKNYTPAGAPEQTGPHYAFGTPAAVEGLASGETYTVTETAVFGGSLDNYTVTGEGDFIASAAQPPAVEIENAKTSAELSLTKEVVNASTLNVWGNGFEFSLYDPADLDTLLEKATATSTNPTVTFHDLEDGKTYRVYESGSTSVVPAGWSYDTAKGLYYTDIKVEGSEQATVVVATNNITELEIKKIVDKGEKSDTFEVQIFDGATAVKLEKISDNLYHYTTSSIGLKVTDTIKITDSQTVMVYGLPHGVTYTVKETDTAGHQSTGEKDVTFLNDPKDSVTFTNTVEDTLFVLQKEITNLKEGDALGDGISFTFQIQNKAGQYLQFKDGECVGTTANESDPSTWITVKADGKAVELKGPNYDPDEVYTITERARDGFLQEGSVPPAQLVLEMIDAQRVGVLRATVENKIVPSDNALLLKKSTEGFVHKDDVFTLAVEGLFFNEDSGKIELTTRIFKFAANPTGDQYPLNTAVEVKNTVLGETYRVFEMEGDREIDLSTNPLILGGYRVEYLSETGKASDPAELLEVRNTRDENSKVEITKELIGKTDRTDGIFTVHVTMDGDYVAMDPVSPSDSGYAYTYSFDGLTTDKTKAAITVKAGETTLIRDLPRGTKLTFTEDVNQSTGYLPTLTSGSKDLDGDTLTLVGVDGYHLTLTNKVVTELTIVKKMRSGNSASATGTYYFKVWDVRAQEYAKFTEQSGVYLYDPVNGTTDEIVVTTAATSGEAGIIGQGAVKISGLPYGERFIVDENTSKLGSYYQLESIENAEFTFSETENSDHEVTAINRRNRTPGGGGGSSDRDRDRDRDRTTTRSTDIPDANVPTSEPFTIEDEEVPLAKLPQTGGQKSKKAGSAGGFMLALAGLFQGMRKRKESQGD